MNKQTGVLKKLLVASVLFSLTTQNGYTKNIELKDNESKKIQLNSKLPNEEDLKKLLKSNMHTFQTMLETYAVDYKGEYPKNIAELIKEAKECKFGSYYKELKNPFDKSLESLADKKSDIKGVVIYEPIKDSKGNITIYKIFANDKTGQHLKDKSNSDFYLTNN